MSLLTDVEAPFKWIGGEAKSAIDALVPADIRAEAGAFAHTFVASVVHDAGAEVKTLTAPLLSELWTYLKTAGASLAAQYAAGGITFTQLIANGVADLKSEASTVVAPALKVIGQQTLTNWLPQMVTTALAAGTTAAAAANPSPASPSPSAPTSSSSSSTGS